MTDEARHQQQVEELCAAAIRALSGQADLHFRGGRLHRGRQRLPLYAPHLHPSLAQDDFGSFRGAADGLALRLKWSDPDLHQRLCPAPPVERLVFDLLEQFRVESLVPPGMTGVVANLRHRHEAWSLGFHHAGHTNGARGLLLYTVAQVCRSRVCNEPVVEATEDLLESTRFAIVPLIGPSLARLRRTRFDQGDYSQAALTIAHQVADLLRQQGGDDDADKPDDRSVEAAERAAFSLLMDLDAQVDDSLPTAATGASRVLAGDGGRYRICTTAYDREAAAASLVRPAQLQAYREQLDARITRQQVNIPRLARALQALLARPQADGWDSGHETGLVDGRRLAQLVAVPTERRLFRAERQAPQADCVLTVLVDCSGSMKQHIETVAMLADVLMRALELAGVSAELLGHTTGAWNGGRAARDWQRAGRPPNPGRLNEWLKLVFKDADSRWRSSRQGIAAVLRGELFREGLDGEAVDWACRRLLARPEPRKLLLVISDGCPMDGATQLANDPYYLDNHLRDVVARHEQAAAIQIHGVGVGLDLSPFYSRSLALDLSAPPGNGVFGELLALLAGRHRR